MRRLLETMLRRRGYIIRSDLPGHKRFPLLNMLEYLGKYNLAHEGSGRLDEYESVIDTIPAID